MITQSPAEPGPAKQPEAEAGTDERMELKQFNFLAKMDMDNYGTFFLAEWNKHPQVCVVKVLKKKFIVENNELSQIRAAKSVGMIVNREKHPFLTHFYGCFQTRQDVYFVMEYSAGGTLMRRRHHGTFAAQQTKLYAAEVCLGLKFLHESGILHRNLALESLWLTQDGHIKIIDYGLCKENFWHESRTGTFCGTAPCMAPEILLDKQYGRPVDWWAFGVLVYQMLFNQMPFRGEDEDEIYDAILTDDPLYPEQVAPQTKDLIGQLLSREPSQRLGSGPTDAKEIIDHAYFQDIVWDDVYHKKVQPSFIPTVTSDTDTSNFDPEFINAPLERSESDSSSNPDSQDHFPDFDYVADFE